MLLFQIGLQAYLQASAIISHGISPGFVSNKNNFVSHKFKNKMDFGDLKISEMCQFSLVVE